LVVVGEAGGGGEQERVRRGAQGGLGAVDLEAGRAAHHQPEAADLLVRTDAGEDPGGARIEAGGQAAIGPPVELALRGEADPDVALRGAAALAPEPARL